MQKLCRKERAYEKSVLSIVLTVAMLFSLTATVWGSAWPVVDSGYCGYWDDNYEDRENITWQLMKDGTLEFFGEGYMEDFSYNRVPWKDYADQIKEVVIYGPQDDLKSCIFSISSYAFIGCKNLTRLRSLTRWWRSARMPLAAAKA